MEKYLYSSEMFKEDTNKLVHMINDFQATEHNKFDLIIGVSRGGLIPAVRLSHLLNIPMVAVNYSLKDDRRHFAFNNEIRNTRNFHHKSILLVEDLADSGNTLRELCEDHMQGMYVRTCVPLYKPHTSCIVPSFYARTYEGNGWVDFFWEIE